MVYLLGQTVENMQESTSKVKNMATGHSHGLMADGTKAHGKMECNMEKGTFKWRISLSVRIAGLTRRDMTGERSRTTTDAKDDKECGKMENYKVGSARQIYFKDRVVDCRTLKVLEPLC